MKKHFKNLIFIWNWYIKDKFKLIIIVITTFWIAISQIITPVFYKKLIDITYLEGLTKSEMVDKMMYLLFILALIYIAEQLFWRITSITEIYFELNLKEKLSRYTFEYLNKHSYKFFSDNMTGSLIKKFGRFIQSMISFIFIFFYDILLFLITLIWSIYVIFTQNIYIGFAYLIYLWIFFIIWFLLSKRSMPHRKNYNENDSQLWWFVADVISNHFNLQIFASDKKELDNYSDKFKENKYLQKKFYFGMELVFWSMWAILIISEIIIFYIIIKLWWSSIISVWTFVLILSYQYSIWNKIFNLPSILRRITESMSDISEMKEILEKPHDIIDTKNAKELNISKWEIVFEDVSFKYFEWQEEVINKLNLTIKPWEKVALVWVSWSGKSTIIKLILRLYDLTSGKILIDEENIAEVTQESLRKNIWLVPQEPVLFHRTLAENISYGKDNTTLDEIIKVSKEAECHKFISKQEKGYDTLVGERWIKLSGWERQRVAIARILLKDAKILLLDEATSALDSESEILIQKAIDKAMKWKTTIAIAHRLSTIMKMDRIVVLQKWKIVEDWSHEELLKKENWVYKKLWEIQSGGFIGE